MKTIVIIFGGKSVEHDVSILTALHAARHVENYKVKFVYITRDNRFLTGDVLGDIDWHIHCAASRDKRAKSYKGARQCWFAEGKLVARSWFGVRRTCLDAVLNCCHGGIGENGELAAAMKIAKIPLASCGTQAALNTQSKSRTREILTEAGFIQPKFLLLTDKDMIPAEEIFEKIGNKVIVKPDTLGSSIGISVATNAEELTAALKLAFSLDKKVIVEEYISDIREINCSALKYGGEVRVSECEVMDNGRAILDFDKKYLEKTQVVAKKSGADVDIPNEDEETFNKIKKLTEEAWTLFECGGVVRVDFMVAGDKIYLTELNTVPGFLAYHLWARAGLPYGVLIDMLIKQAIADYTDSSQLNTVFESKILEKNRVLVK